MSQLSRRKLLAASALVAGAAAISPAPAAYAAADPYDTLRKRWFSMLAGGRDHDVQSPGVAARLKIIDAEAKKWWDLLIKTSDRKDLWSDLNNPNDSAHTTAAYTRLRSMALAHATYGSAYAGNQTLRNDVVSGMEWLHANRYRIEPEPEGNWWDIQIGTPLALNDATTLMFDYLTAEQVAKYMAVVHEWTPKVEMTAANRLWKAEVVAISGILLKDDAKLKDATSEIRGEMNYAGGTENRIDGFYRDGSFIQHEKYAYTGAYGTAFLGSIAKIIALFINSPWQVKVTEVEYVYEWVPKAFEPLLFRGAMMDMVRGRDISRPAARDHFLGHRVLGAIILLAGTTTDVNLAKKFRSLVKAHLQADTFFRFESISAIPLVISAEQIRQDPAISPRSSLNTYRQYHNMDRAVAQRPAWALGIAMSSQRIRQFESIRSENLKGWYTGAGATYLYAADLRYYSDDYWPTIDPLRIPGTTVARNAPRPGNKYDSPAIWAGGTALAGPCGVSGMEYRDEPAQLSARKSWFVFDDEIVAVGSGIAGGSGMEVETIVDNRLLNAAGTNEVRINGALQPTSLTDGERSTTGVNRVHLKSAVALADVGYYFPNPVTLWHQRLARTGSWKAINANASAEPLTRHYQQVWLAHGVNPDPATSSYGYFILPCKTAAQVDAYAQNPPARILAQGRQVHAAAAPNLGIQAANFFDERATTAGLITSYHRSSVMIKESSGRVDVAIADPTHVGTRVIIEIARVGKQVIKTDAEARVLELSPKIKIEVNVENARGKTFTVAVAV